MWSLKRLVWTTSIGPPIYPDVCSRYQCLIRVAPAEEIESKGARLGFVATGRRTIRIRDHGTGVGIGRIAEGAERRRARCGLTRLVGREGLAAVRRPHPSARSGSRIALRAPTCTRPACRA